MQTKIHVDSESAVCVVKNHVYHSKTKHIKIRHHFIRDSYEKRLIEMVKIHTDYNVADLLIKAFDVTRNEFSTNLPSAVICFAKGQNFNFSKLIFDGGDSAERAITTDASLVATHDSDTINKTQTTTIPNVDLPQGMDTCGSPKRQETMGGTPAQTSTVNRVTTLENELSSTKAVYHKAFITLTKKVKKLETQLKQKISRAVIHSLDEEEPSLDAKDSPKQGRMIGEIDKDETINMVSKQREVQETAGPLKDDNDATLAETLWNTKRSKTKDQRKGIMQETKLPRKIKKREMIRLSLDEELVQKLDAKEIAKETARQEHERDDLDTMSLDDVYNHLKVYEPAVQKKSETNSQNMAFISSSNTSSGKGEVHTASIKYEDITQIDEDDIDEMDIKWNMALLSMRANRAPRSQDRGKRESYRQGPKEEERAPKALMAIDGIGWDWSYMDNEEENNALIANKEVPTEFALMAKSSSSDEGPSIEERALLFLEAQDRVKEKAQKLNRSSYLSFILRATSVGMRARFLIKMPPKRNNNIYDVYERIMAIMEERLDQFVDQFTNQMNDMMNPRRRRDRNGRRSEGKESENPFFEGDDSSLFVERKEWEDDHVADDDYKEGPVFDDDPYKEEIVSGDVGAQDRVKEKAKKFRDA
nr:putative ribonuclease H-like domain-containing protein [Tanacetum cinerariifolium]